LRTGTSSRDRSRARTASITASPPPCSPITTRTRATRRASATSSATPAAVASATSAAARAWSSDGCRAEPPPPTLLPPPTLPLPPLPAMASESRPPRPAGAPAAEVGVAEAPRSAPLAPASPLGRPPADASADGGRTSAARPPPPPPLPLPPDACDAERGRRREKVWAPASRRPPPPPPAAAGGCIVATPTAVADAAPPPHRRAAAGGSVTPHPTPPHPTPPRAARPPARPPVGAPPRRHLPPTRPKGPARTRAHERDRRSPPPTNHPVSSGRLPPGGRRRGRTALQPPARPSRAALAPGPSQPPWLFRCPLRLTVATADGRSTVAVAAAAEAGTPAATGRNLCWSVAAVGVEEGGGGGGGGCGKGEEVLPPTAVSLSGEGGRHIPNAQREGAATRPRKSRLGRCISAAQPASGRSRSLPTPPTLLPLRDLPFPIRSLTATSRVPPPVGGASVSGCAIAGTRTFTH